MQVRVKAAPYCWHADYPFREIIGVELSPELDRIARANIARYTARRAHPPVVSLQGDAAAFEWPPGPLIVYMWNAFTRPVMEQVFENLDAWFAQEPQELYLVYMHPELESMLSEHPWLIRLWREEFIMSEEDYSAWAFPNPGRGVRGLQERSHQSHENQVTICHQPSIARNKRVCRGCYDCLEQNKACLNRSLRWTDSTNVTSNCVFPLDAFAFPSGRHGSGYLEPTAQPSPPYGFQKRRSARTPRRAGANKDRMFLNE